VGSANVRQKPAKNNTPERRHNPSVIRDMAEVIEKGWDLSSPESATNELWTEEFKAFQDAATLKSLFFTEDWVFIVVDLMAGKLSSLPLVVKKIVKKGTTSSTEIVPDHPLLALFDYPNEWQDYSQFIYNLFVEYFLMGNAIVWSAARSGQLLTLPTEVVSLDFDQKQKLRAYVLHSVNQESAAFRYNQEVSRFDVKDILHFRRPNPSSMLWGLSAWVPGRKSVLFNRYSSDYLGAFYVKQATPGLALTLDKQVNEDVALRQLRSFEVAYQGRKNTRRTLILPKGVDVKTLSHTLSDQKLLEHINQNRETICGLFKVPKHELSLQTAGSLGSEEYKTALKNFWESTLKPAAEAIARGFTRKFKEVLGEDSYFEFDLSGVEALKDDILKKAELAAKMLAAGLSINEVRQEVWQQEAYESEDADKPFVLVTQPSPFVGQVPKPEEAPQEEEEETLPDSEKVKQIREQHVKALDTEESRTIGTLATSAIDLLVGMTLRAIEVIEESNKSAPAGVKKDLPSRRILEQRIKRALSERFEESWANEIARTLSQSIEIGYDSQLELIFNAEAKREIEVLRARDSEGRRATLELRGLESFAGISKTHTERIMARITRGQKEGQSITNIMRAVADELGTPGELKGKAETIARTETLTAVSLGQSAAMTNAMEVIPGLRKAWLSAGDARVRDSHQSVDRQVVKASKSFKNGLQYPRDTAGPPEETINCRCTMVLLEPGENLEI